MRLKTPVIENRDREALLGCLRKQLAGFVPGWLPPENGSGMALMRIFARYLEILAEGVNQVPERSLMAFLDMLGTHLLPAQGAQAPLVFTLIDGAPVDVTLPAGSLVAAPAKPEPSSPLQPAINKAPSEDALFATRQTIILARARLATLYSLHPGSDEYVDHSTALEGNFTLFDGMSQTEHAIYLGHDNLFALGGENIVVMLSFSLSRFASRELKTQWEYLTESGWSPLESASQDDTTGGMRHDGLIMLRRDCGPVAKKDTIEGRTSYWLRGRLITPLLPDGPRGERTVPVINDIRARVGFTRSGIAPEVAFLDSVPLDISKDFYPFGQQPNNTSAFYLACKDVFSRKGAQVRVDIVLSSAGNIQGPLQLNWEYYNGNDWCPLNTQPSSCSSGYYQFSNPNGTVSFSCPQNWAESAINGVKNYWLRIRVIKGNFGFLARVNPDIPGRTIKKIEDRMVLTLDTNEGFVGGEEVIVKLGSAEVPTLVAFRQNINQVVLATPLPGGVDFTNGTITASPKYLAANLYPPVVSKITFSFTYLTDPFELHHCLSNNDFLFEDHTEDARWPDRKFAPFRAVADLFPSVHFGFDNRLPVGLISAYVNVDEQTEAPPKGTPFIWEYRSEGGWIELGVLDETQGFRQSGMIQFVGPSDAIATRGLGGQLFRVRARLKPGEAMRPLPLSGVWFNAVWADHRSTSTSEELGLGDGSPGQSFTVQRTPVLPGEMVEVQEWRGRGEDWRTTLGDVHEKDLRFERDPATGMVTSVWVTWREQKHLYHSQPGDRHYLLERATGLFRFGDGLNGLLPPAGSRIIVTYYHGGGLSGNVVASSISEFRMAVPYIESVINPVPASGGAAIETSDAVQQRGPQRLRHQDRAVSVKDYEWLAREASPDVARVCCLPITGPAGHAQRGWITLMVAPFSTEPQPQPLPGFGRRIREHLVKRVPVTVSRQIRIIGPQYTLVGVKTEIVPKEAGEAALVEARVRDHLNRFLHPLTGGFDGDGWSFGQAVYLSQIARIIEETAGVDYAMVIRLVIDEQIYGDWAPIDHYSLLAAGSHEIKLIMGGN